jgi:hypothetical protein
MWCKIGWVAYAVTALLMALGERRLMPPPDSMCKVINGRTGYVRENSSFILGRIVRDFEVWMDGGQRDGPIRNQIRCTLEKRTQAQRDAEKARRGPRRGGVSETPRVSLCVSIYRADHARPGHPGYDWLYFLGFGTAILQLGIAAIPCGVFGDWSILVVTGAGIVLSFATGSLPQWSKEKWACRRNSEKTVILTKGNGSQHAIVIIGDGNGLDIEDLAAGPIDTDFSTFFTTRIALLILTLLWVLLLIVAAGARKNSWFLLAVGGVGILENVFVAGSPRTPAAFGMPLIFEDVVCEGKVMDTLFAVEQAYPRVGKSMVGTFFPGNLRPKEQERWDELERLADALEESVADQGGG